MKNRNPFTIGKIRTLLYSLAKILGDINAIKGGTIGKRIVRRTAGKIIGRQMGRWFR
jgi:hypothetical protein